MRANVGAWRVAALCGTLLLGSCAPQIVGRTGDQREIPFVWDMAVGTIPVQQMTADTPDTQYVTLPECRRAAVQAAEIRRHGLAATQQACVLAVQEADRRANVFQGSMGFVMLPITGFFIWLLWQLLH